MEKKKTKQNKKTKSVMSNSKIPLINQEKIPQYTSRNKKFKLIYFQNN